MVEQINLLLWKIKLKKPVILNITNAVSTEFVANGLICLGASPIMSQARCEIGDLLKIANSVVINIGTLNAEFIELCHEVCRTANQLKKPITFDPVGAGASDYRTKTSLEFLTLYDIAILRGNASEIMALTDYRKNSKGVDADITTQFALKSAHALTRQCNTLVVISGKEDAVVFDNQEHLFDRGSALMPMVTGSGCLLTAVISAFAAIHDNIFEAAQAAVLFYSICGENAAQKAVGPGTFKAHFLDALSGVL